MRPEECVGPSLGTELWSSARTAEHPSLKKKKKKMGWEKEFHTQTKDLTERLEKDKQRSLCASGLGDCVISL